MLDGLTSLENGVALTQGNPAMAAKYMSEHMPRYVRGKAAYKERWRKCLLGVMTKKAQYILGLGGRWR